MAKKNPFKDVHLYAKVLGAYSRLLEQVFEERLISAKDRDLLQRIYQRLKEVSTLIDQLKANSK